MSDGKITQMSWVGIIGVNIGMWYSILTYGIFTTLLPVIGITIIVGLIIKLNERNK
jgi:hypothetical protein